MLSNAALLIIDMQNDVMDKLPLSKEILPGIKEVLDKFRSAGKPVFHIRRSYRSDGTNVELPRLKQFKQNGFRIVEGTEGEKIVEELAPTPEEYVIIKPRWSGFDHTPLELLLKRLEVKTVVLTGIQTPNCVRTTAFDAVAYDYETIVIKDCSAAASPEIHEYNLSDMANIGVKIVEKSDILDEFK